MPIHTLSSNFSGGEVSPHLYPRTDVASYASWLKNACNFFIHTQGGASNRPGTLYVQTAKYANKSCRLIPFVLAEEEAYVLEVGHLYIRVHTQAGTLLRNGVIFELSSPYQDYEVEQINYVQYDQTLFLVHPAHPPYKLMHTADGYFTLQEVNIVNGPFMVGNSEETHKMRLVNSDDTVVSEGVKAVLSFLPMNYPNYFIQAFWQGARFYDPTGYGFDVQGVVDAFNEVYGSTGCVAYNQGGVLRIESPQATGGNYNGAQLVIHYRSGLVAPPNLIVTQEMSGGQNAGEIISSGENKYYLEADFDVFRPGHVGALWSLNHRVESPYVTGTLGYDSTSQVIQSGGDWGFRTTGNWYGEIVLESSFDQVTWEKVKHFTRTSTEDNLNTLGNLNPSEKMYYLRIRCLGITGEMGYVLRADSFSQEGIVKLEGYVDERTMQVSICRQPGEMETWTADWAEGAFSPDAGYPRCVFFFQDRLGFAATAREPQSLWFSRTGEYEDFGYFRTVQDSDAISINLSSKKLNAIHSVAVGSKLLVFTAGSEWSVSSSGALTPYSVTISQEGERGSSQVAPLIVGNRILFVQARGGVLRDYVYEYNSASYTGRDLTLRARHLFFNREIKEIVYQQEPDNLVWCVLDDGALLCLTYMAEEEVFAWSRHETQGSFLSACTIPARGYDEMWFLVQRGNVRFIERLSARLPTKNSEDQLFLDASISKKNTTAFSSITGLNHLEGKEVTVLADGNLIGGLTVQNGAVTLPRAVNTAQVGLPYTALLQTLPVDIMAEDGTLQDRQRRLIQVRLKVLDSRGGQVGTEGGKMDELVYNPLDNFGSAPVLQTRDVRKVFASNHHYFPSVIIRQQDPLPLTVLAILAQIA